MSFKNVRLSERVSLGAAGGPGFKTSITETVSGDEYRNINWSKVRGRWNVGFQRAHAENEEVIRFFYAMNGRGYGFRFKDWSDYKCDSVIGYGDDETRTFQASKTYQVGEAAYTRALTRLVDGTALVYVDDVLRTSGVVVDPDTGLITFSRAPEAGHAIRLVCEFDVPVRFDTDDLEVTMITQHISQINAPIIEIRDRP
ncbi:phage distal tail protein, Rcc01695 family [Orrella sp. 11846]|uniref:phage distal tail protein, Rcc01695 family n=1 Tax=Orrella sp. 11846 TaxID=3409913 RepID=UPI003B5AAA00